MNSLHNDWPLKKWAWVSLSGLLIYILLQILPSIASPEASGLQLKLIEKSEAERHAKDFILQEFGQSVLSSHAIHQSSKSLSGYLAKEKLTDTYNKEYDKQFPVDTYQVEVTSPRINSAGAVTQYYVYVHMQTGNIVAWNRLGALIDEEQRITNPDEARQAVIGFAQKRGFKPEQLDILSQSEDGSHTTVMVLDNTRIGEAKLQLRIQPVKMPDGRTQILTYKPSFKVPASYTDLVARQDKQANAMAFFGNLVMSGLLFVLSIIYAVLYRQHSSFKRGLIMTIVFAVFYIASNYNMADGVMSIMGENPDAELNVSVKLIIASLLSLILAVSVYFALIAGDGLWRQMGFKLWPRFGEQGFGETVWRSMKQGYLLALMLLGIQTLILLVLQYVLGVWTTTDVTQSPYNMKMPWLFPVIAWCAAISEEAIYRLFGIGLLRKWLKNTFIASLIPTVIWAMGHVTYPLYPSTTRLFELVIIGLIFSYILIRFGFITAVFTHAIFNTVMMCVMLFFLGDAVNIAAALFYLVLPVIIAWLLRGLHRRFKPSQAT
ncbi:CPBP family intramembrane glutamic endopeptidase [Paenibacillus sp. GCM10012307]|uniref:CPBP family intramembrane metalloprotease n=1 Tax=Paenibacillus roseus TaxID=2798579 RepID=A0A934J882_9BACL|nr:type II CAAX endopeptidase family protein [Paenibacillus roseus]MBJ6362227.1 CPBP family intramembrane metalloprotease [Paenibacillus roseus]